jgi:H+/Cl- antiporter ClcA
MFTNSKRKAFYARQELGLRHRFRYKIIEVLVYSLVTSAVLLSVSLFAEWACKKEVDHSSNSQLDEVILSSQFNCDNEHSSEPFKILLGSREDAIRGIFSDPLSYDPKTLFTVGILFCILMSLTFGISVPSGIFMPSILAGSALGGFAGICFQKYFIASLEPSTFALLGAAALLAGIQRNTVSLCVILMEGTSETKILIPLIVTICVACDVGGLFNEGIYEILIEMKGYLYLEHGLGGNFNSSCNMAGGPYRRSAAFVFILFGYYPG